MADAKKKAPPVVPSAEMIALLRERQGGPTAPIIPSLAEDTQGSNYVPPPRRLEPAPMPRNPASEIALLNQQLGTPMSPEAAQSMLAEGLGTEYAPARAQTLSGMGPRFQQPQPPQKLPSPSSEAMMRALRASRTTRGPS